MTIRYFPRPYPDEILYSVIARFSRHLCLESPKVALDWLFGDRSVRSSVRLQPRLANLSARLDTVLPYSPTELAKDFTLFGYETSFRPKAEAELVLAALVDGSANWIHPKLGLVATSIRPSRTLSYCPDCAREDLLLYGETYWRRAHQLPGVVICVEHLSLLCQSGVDIAASPQHSFLGAQVDLSQRTPVAISCPAPSARDMLVRLARHSSALLTDSVYGEQETFGGAYKRELIARGFGRGNRIDQPALADAFTGHFGGIHGFVPAARPDGWLEHIPRRHRKAVHPLRHLLVRLFLEDHAVSAPFRPFGLGPWRCRNPLAGHVGEPVITTIQVHRDHGDAVGRFNCRCGYVFSQKVGGKPIVTRYGPLFERRLRTCLTAGTGLRATARELFVDTNTVVFQAAQLKLKTKWATRSSGKSRDADRRAGRTLKRGQWRKLEGANAGVSKTEIRRLAPALYAWLYRNDKQWLAARCLANTPGRKHKPRHDWPSIDVKMSGLLLAAADDIRAAVPPVRVTLAALERAIGRPGWFYSRRGKLPLSIDTLDRLSERLELFQCRRVLWAAAQLEGDGLPINDSNLRRRGGLKKPEAPIVEVLLMACLKKDVVPHAEPLQVAA